ncbi:GNAT family N-acetyltransferase [Viridibacillus sp. YIM B01967]|uniref:GNAT family N-acetyltransferase n=1 Tax=Viridibacillus soli TaxID=2798301 RepID=A0ABS1HD69_9BACL|nr:GNAT family N-acetyltransferase [Viridibacillus soli]MBK3497392.1 GNAT family N-acetyltransferase [Viridibacillus soli]
MSVEFVNYNNQYKELVEDYQVTEEQLQFTNSPLAALELCETDADRYPIIVFHNSQLVSFFVLYINKGVEPYSDNCNAILLRSLSTDYRHLRKGFSKSILSQLPQFIKQKFININEIILAVNAENKTAQDLYKKIGFVDNEKRIQWRNSQQIIMNYAL